MNKVCLIKSNRAPNRTVTHVTSLIKDLDVELVSFNKRTYNSEILKGCDKLVLIVDKVEELYYLELNKVDLMINLGIGLYNTIGDFLKTNKASDITIVYENNLNGYANHSDGLFKIIECNEDILKTLTIVRPKDYINYSNLIIKGVGYRRRYKSKFSDLKFLETVSKKQYEVMESAQKIIINSKYGAICNKHYLNKIDDEIYDGVKGCGSTLINLTKEELFLMASLL